MFYYDDSPSAYISFRCFLCHDTSDTWLSYSVWHLSHCPGSYFMISGPLSKPVQGMIYRQYFNNTEELTELLFSADCDIRGIAKKAIDILQQYVNIREEPIIYE